MSRPEQSYQTGVDPGGEWIACGLCGFRSYNRNDIANRYCGNCHRFHDQDGRPELLLDRTIAKCRRDEDGLFEVTFSCGHLALFVIEPAAGYSSPCAQCVELWIAENRGKAAQ